MLVYTGFFVLSGLMLLSPFWVFQEAKVNRKLQRHYLIGAGIWVVYVILMSRSGILRSFDLPPRVPLLLIIPMIITGIVISGRRWFKRMLFVVSPHRPVYIQSFRIMVELLIYGAFINGIFPQKVTFEGINYDVLVGISALIIGLLIERHRISNIAVIIWNIVSLSVLSVTGYSFISSYYFGEFASETIALKFTELPYVLLPAILLQFAIFYHIVSIRKSLEKK